ncbi:N-acetylglucosamine-6-phosphate deacetylase [Radiobacillus sp. PE A8.2]|uniref:N-acetylglucosamine-6-phosphate deacetylase n=1 Tax=Radiobacillus sp. PE A8.2 TaxID=3380349 RepID=UPI0038910346
MRRANVFYLFGSVISDALIMTNTYVEVTNSTITYVGKEKQNSTYPVIDVNEAYICPGFIDNHVHGLSGYDFMDDEFAITAIANGLPEFGVTSFVATTRTAPLEQIEEALRNANNYLLSKIGKAELLGVHLEGPWISQKYCGAQKKELIRNLTWMDLEIIDRYIDIISLITLAPEEIDDLSLITYWGQQGIHLSAGHTAADVEEMEAAKEAGVKQVTHMFNAMSSFHHRTPGTAAAALLFDEIQCELIADGHHVTPKMIELLYKVKGFKKINLISDCTGYNHLENGLYHFRKKN